MIIITIYFLKVNSYFKTQFKTRPNLKSYRFEYTSTMNFRSHMLLKKIIIIHCTETEYFTKIRRIKLFLLDYLLHYCSILVLVQNIYNGYLDISWSIQILFLSTCNQIFLVCTKDSNTGSAQSPLDSVATG